MKPLPVQVVPVTIEIIKSMMDTVTATWDEVDQRKGMGMTLDPDWYTLSVLESSGLLFCYKLGGGYGVFIKTKDLHRKGKYYITSSVIYLPKEQRGEFKRMLSILEKDFKAVGADFLSISLKTSCDGEYNGYKLYEQVYQRAL